LLAFFGGEIIRYLHATRSEPEPVRR
jgi:hypothetical protein